MHMVKLINHIFKTELNNEIVKKRTEFEKLDKDVRIQI